MRKIYEKQYGSLKIHENMKKIDLLKQLDKYFSELANVQNLVFVYDSLSS